MKLLLLTAVFLFGTIGESFAQRQKITESYLMRTDINNVVFKGNKTYYYIVGEDGGQLKDGQYTISCPQASYSVSVFPYTYKLVGSYNMTANHSKGKLNGAISSNYKMTVTSSNGQSDKEYQTITGNFTNGVPNGTFIVNAKRTLITKLNATYKNGILVGAFSCDVLGWDNLPHKYSGTLTQSGKLNGTWTYLGGTMLFQNGVLISDNDTDKGKSTPPAISALAKQYAAGSITKDALAEKGYTVLKSEIELGKYASTCILRDSGVDFEDLGGCIFEQEAVEYEYLKQVCYLNKEGVEQLIADLENKGECSFAYDGYRGFECIQKDGDSKPYVKIHQRDKNYVSGFFDDYYVNAYIKDEDMTHIYDRIAEIAKPLKEYAELIPYYGNSNTDPDINLYKLKKLLDVFSKTGKQITKDVYQVAIDYTYNNKFILAESVKEVEDSIAKRTTMVKQESIKKVEDANTKQTTNVKQEIQARIKAQLEHALNFIQSQGKAFSIVFDTDFEKYLWYDKNSKFWKLDAEKVLKPFCPMVDYEIIDANRETITCKWSVQGKKKVISTYELTLKHKNGKLVIDAESFNVNLVKKTE